MTIPTITNGVITRAPLPEGWALVKASKQSAVDMLVPGLLTNPAKGRILWLSDLIGPIDLNRWVPVRPWHLARCQKCGHIESSEHFGEDRGYDDSSIICPHCDSNRVEPDIPGIDWLILSGGEAPLHPQWARRIRDQCAAAGVPFLFEMWGDWEPMATVDGRQMLPFGEYILPSETSPGFGFFCVGSANSGRTLDRVTHDQMPEGII